MGRDRLKKKDGILILILLLIAGALYLVFLLIPRKEAFYAVAKVDGREVGRWKLAEDTEADIDTSFGHNRIHIENGTVFMIEADCPDGYCKEQHAIGENGGSIICLPHHLVIETQGSDGTTVQNDGVDTIAK